jgi:CheY-like chemotaxis protein
MLQLLKVSISKHAILKLNLARDLPAVQANPTQLRQVVMNLITNASEAIGEREGVIHISAVFANLGPNRNVAEAGSLPEGDYLRLEVTDTGVGMTPEIQAKVFDPFFTTKFPGRGLGLAVVQGIIREHRGAIEFVSNPGRGTTCLVWLPCAAKMVPKPGSLNVTMANETVESPPRTIMVVEDEDVLRIAVSKALRKNGFSVIEASDGSTAMETMLAHTNDIDAILLDVTLPGISSQTILEEAGRLRPDLKVILTSAYSNEAVESSFGGLPVRRFIRKPFQINELLAVVQNAILE